MKEILEKSDHLIKKFLS
jgi:DNA polymerase sigma